MKRHIQIVFRSMLIVGLLVSAQPAQAGWPVSLSGNFSLRNVRAAVANKAGTCWESLKKSGMGRAAVVVAAAAGCYLVASTAYKKYSAYKVQRALGNAARDLEQALADSRLHRAAGRAGGGDNPELSSNKRCQWHVAAANKDIEIAQSLLRAWRNFSGEVPADLKKELVNELHGTIDFLRGTNTKLSVLVRRTSINFVGEVHVTYTNNMRSVGGDPRQAYQLLGLDPREHAHATSADIMRYIQASLDALDREEELKHDNDDERNDSRKLLRQLGFFFRNDYTLEEYRAYLDGELGLRRLWIHNEETIEQLMRVFQELPPIIFALQEAYSTLVGQEPR